MKVQICSDALKSRLCRVNNNCFCACVALCSSFCAALSNRDRLLSRRFGSSSAGWWHIALLPVVDGPSYRDVAVYLFQESDAECNAEFSFVLLDGEGEDIAGTKETEELTIFSSENKSWGFHHFLSLTCEDDINQYLVNQNTLKIKVHIRVYHGCMHVAPGEKQDALIPQIPLPTNPTESGSSTEFTTLMPYSLPGTFSESSQTNANMIKTDSCGQVGKGIDVAHVRLRPQSQKPNLDIALVCHGQHFKCNRAIVSAKSQVLMDRLYGNYQDPSGKEIDISSVDPLVASTFVEFLSTGM
eukprot:GHVT01016491.1.p1 GENE.GHVT01016491.1~~GHVT01016491.1.p1  ORF type:complete len:299 (+),score=17.65 GHVT01016491.1:342-1238(+)